jgi:hypothetical protein
MRPTAQHLFIIRSGLRQTLPPFAHPGHRIAQLLGQFLMIGLIILLQQVA